MEEHAEHKPLNLQLRALKADIYLLRISITLYAKTQQPTHDTRASTLNLYTKGEAPPGYFTIARICAKQGERYRMP